MAPIAGYAPQALLLRRLALRLLAPDAAPDVTIESVTPGAWNVFLTIEQCAAAFRPVLPSDGHFPELDRFATADLQRSLAARSQLIRIAALARERSWKVVVLKGAISITEGRHNFLQDIDLLVAPETALDLARAIRSELGMSPGGQSKSRHLPTMGGPDLLPVEVHFSLDGRAGSPTQAAWGRVVPLPGVPGLWRLAPVDHCLHVLTHTVVDHPDRRGRLRDRLVLRDALAQCSSREIEELATMVRKNPYAQALLDELTFVREWHERVPPDPFERAAFVSYWLTERQLPWSRNALPDLWNHIYGTVWQWILFKACGWPARRWQRDSLLERSPGYSEFAPIAFLERRMPPIGGLLRLSLRLLHYTIARGIGWPIALFAGRAADRCGVPIALSNRSSSSAASANVSRPSERL